MGTFLVMHATGMPATSWICWHGERDEGSAAGQRLRAGQGLCTQVHPLLARDLHHGTQDIGSMSGDAPRHRPYCGGLRFVLRSLTCSVRVECLACTALSGFMTQRGEASPVSAIF